MKAVHKFLLGGAAAAAATVALAAPAAAQYYPYPGGVGDVLVGSILNNILRGGYNGGYGGGYQYGGYDFGNERWAVDQCARATEQRVNGGYGGGYGYNGGLRVAQIDRVERTRNLNFRVYGLVTPAGYRGNYGAYSAPYGGYGYNAAPAYRFSCKVSRSSGRITDLDVDRLNNRYRY